MGVVRLSDIVVTELVARRLRPSERLDTVVRRLLGLRPASRSKYALETLEVGESRIVPWLESRDGGPRHNQSHIHRAVFRAQARHGMRFDRVALPSGLKVTRVS